MIRRVYSGVVVCLVVGATLLPARRTHAVYEPERLEDPSRRWAMNVGFYSEYDDNFNTSNTNREDGFHAGVTGVLRATIPREQTFFRMRYEYRASYTPDRMGSDRLDQSHLFDGLISHTFSPRLVLNVNESLRRAIEPAFVDVESGQPIVLQRRGDYTFNNASATLDYSLSRRWKMTVQTGWELWRYDISTTSSNFTLPSNDKIQIIFPNIGPSINDRDVYRGTLEFLYALSPRTFTGVGYELSAINYVEPGSNDTRNSISQVGYVAFNHVFSPRLSVVSNVGGSFDEFGDGTQDVSPFVNASLNYNFSKDGTASLGIRYSILATELATFRSSDTLELHGQLSYRLTQKFRASLTGLYSMSTLKHPISTASLPKPIPEEEDTYVVALGLAYDFTRWANATLQYNYDRLLSEFPDRSFSRNRVGLGFNFSY